MNYLPNPPTQSKRSMAGLMFLCSLLILLGCTGSSPRFKGTTKTVEKSDPQPRFAAKIRQEEMAEDDKKVNIGEVKERSAAAPSTPPEHSIERKKVMTEILSLIGTPYAFGSNSSEGMDCSSFTGHVYKNAINRTLPRSTGDQYKVGKSLGNNRLKFGDLVFFNTTGESPSHVGIFIGDDLFAHASVSFGVTISSLQSSYYKKRYIGARRVLE